MLSFHKLEASKELNLESLALHFVHMVLNQEGNVDGMEIFKYLWDEFNVRNLADWRDVRVRPQDHKQVEFAAETNRLLVQLLRKHLKLFDREGDRESKTVITFCFFMMNALIVNNQRVTNGFKVRLRLLQSDVEQIEEFFKKEPGQGLIDDQAYTSWYRLGQSMNHKNSFTGTFRAKWRIWHRCHRIALCSRWFHGRTKNHACR